MVVIGVASDGEGEIEELLKGLFSQNGKKACIMNCDSVSERVERALEEAGIKYLVVSLVRGRIRPVYLDVLILEAEKCVDYSLVKCISPDTVLIYNRDNRALPEFVHPRAISYGMSYRAEATVSSVEDKLDCVSIVYCLQRAVESLGGEILCQGEMSVEISGRDVRIGDVLAAVTCGIVCDLPMCTENGYISTPL